MTPAIQSMLARYACQTSEDYINAFKEIMQEVALLGLWRSQFFEEAAFYGGTSLRILYALDRFSEDLDFSLLKPQKNFKLTPYLKAIQEEMESLGFEVSIEERQKNIQTVIESAFIKAGTREHLIKAAIPETLSSRIPRNTSMQVKLEIDTDPPASFETEMKTLLLPIPFAIRSYQLPDLFAGKIHAVLQRQWKTRVKGRDYYDFVWYVARKIPVRLKHLEARLRQSGGWSSQKKLTEKNLRDLLEKKFFSLDIAAAKKDVLPFLKDKAAVALWSSDFFISLLEKLEVV